MSGMSGVFHVDEESYDDFMGRYSVVLSPLFADFAGVVAGRRVLDVGAGTGALTAEIVRRGAEAVAVEPSPEFVVALRSRLRRSRHTRRRPSGCRSPTTRSTLRLPSSSSRSWRTHRRRCGRWPGSRALW